jgi:hypothetical protein
LQWSNRRSCLQCTALVGRLFPLVDANTWPQPLRHHNAAVCVCSPHLVHCSVFSIAMWRHHMFAPHCHCLYLCLHIWCVRAVLCCAVQHDGVPSRP